MKGNYKGIIVDKMGVLKTRFTKWYETYKETYDAAEKLCKNTMGDRGEIFVKGRDGYNY